MHSNVLYDVQTMSIEELEDKYDIEVDEDGFVWDRLEGKEFDSIGDWAAYTSELEQEEETFVKRGGKGRWDDDRY